MFAIIVLMVGVSVQAQKKNRLQPNPIGPLATSALTLEDQTGGGCVWFIMASEATSECNMCEYSIGFGKCGQVKVDGFNVHLSAVYR